MSESKGNRLLVHDRKVYWFTFGLKECIVLYFDTIKDEDDSIIMISFLSGEFL